MLSWETSRTHPLQLQRSRSTHFSRVVEHTVSASGAITITGLGDGSYYFRLRDSEGGYSNTVKVDVAHHSLTRAFSFFLLGLVLFALLSASIVIGSRTTRNSNS